MQPNAPRVNRTPSRPAGPLQRVYQTHSVYTPQIGLNVGMDARPGTTPPPADDQIDTFAGNNLVTFGNDKIVTF